MIKNGGAILGRRGTSGCCWRVLDEALLDEALLLDNALLLDDAPPPPVFDDDAPRSRFPGPLLPPLMAIVPSDQAIIF